MVSEVPVLMMEERDSPHIFMFHTRGLRIRGFRSPALDEGANKVKGVCSRSLIVLCSFSPKNRIFAKSKKSSRAAHTTPRRTIQQRTNLRRSHTYISSPNVHPYLRQHINNLNLKLKPDSHTHQVLLAEHIKMPAYIPIIALVALPLILGTVITIAAYKVYRKRRDRGRDVELGRIKMVDLEREDAVTAATMPSPPEPVAHASHAVSPATSSSVHREISKVAAKEIEGIEELRGWNLNVPNYLFSLGDRNRNRRKIEPEPVELSISPSPTRTTDSVLPLEAYTPPLSNNAGLGEIPVSSPKPMYTHPHPRVLCEDEDGEKGLSFEDRNDKKADTLMAWRCGEDQRVRDAWRKIERRESLVGPKTGLPIMAYMAPSSSNTTATTTTNAAIEEMNGCVEGKEGNGKDDDDGFVDVDLGSLAGSIGSRSSSDRDEDDGEREDDGDMGAGRSYALQIAEMQEDKGSEEELDNVWGDSSVEEMNVQGDAVGDGEVEIKGGEGEGWTFGAGDVGGERSELQRDGLGDERIIGKMVVGSDWSEGGEIEGQGSVGSGSDGEKEKDLKMLVSYVSSDDE